MEELSRYLQIETRAEALGLCIMGAVPSTELSDSAHNPDAIAQKAIAQKALGPLILLGTGPGFWSALENSPEFTEGTADPIDQWSRRVLTKLAASVGARVRFPFGGPPYEPFVAWAQKTGRFFTSPSQMMVHDQQGMMISLRGALEFEDEFAVPPPPHKTSPCERCASRACVSTCPVGALPAGGPYHIEACTAHIASEAGSPCLRGGCLARRACPLSEAAQRDPRQNAHHMRAFLAARSPQPPATVQSTIPAT